MKDIEILNQLLNGNHLSDTELERADYLLKSLGVALKQRIR